jgi:pre-mRNA-splicing factor SYF1
MSSADVLPADYSEEDLIFEEELLRAPHQLKVWWRYIDARKDATTAKRHLLYERALRALPGSYKLWHAYLSERLELARALPVGSPALEALNNTFERALVTMHKMPRIWELFLRTLLEQRLVTRTRRACDRALAALPVTQHERVWSTYLVRPRPARHGRRFKRTHAQP